MRSALRRSYPQRARPARAEIPGPLARRGSPGRWRGRPCGHTTSVLVRFLQLQARYAAGQGRIGDLSDRLMAGGAS